MDNHRYYDVKGKININAPKAVVLLKMRDALFEQHCRIEHKDDSSIVFTSRGTAHYAWLRGTFIGVTRGVVSVESKNDSSVASYQICLGEHRVGIAILFALFVFMGIFSRGFWPGVLFVIPGAVFAAAAYSLVWSVSKIRIAWFFSRVQHHIASA